VREVKIRPALRSTARELLVQVGGDAHQDHTVVARERASRSVIRFRCSCGSTFGVPVSDGSEDALRNVLQVAVS
jgi:hypothetical protein